MPSVMRLIHWVIWTLFITGYFTEGSERVKRDDLLSNLGTELNKMLGSLLGNGHSSSQQETGQASSQQQNPPVVQQQSQDTPRQLPTSGKNSAYDRRVAQINAKRRAKQHQSQPQPQPQQSSGPQQSAPQNTDGQVHVVDGTGKLSYCQDYPADCAYLDCLAENFQHSEQADTLKMAGKVFLDRDLRRAVANDPMISQAACEKVGLEAQGCDTFKQLLNMVDELDPGPDPKEEQMDPEKNRGRRKRAKVDYDHYDIVDLNTNGGANVDVGEPTGGQGGSQGANGNGPSHGNGPSSNGNGPATGNNGNGPSHGNNGNGPSHGNNGNGPSHGNNGNGPSQKGNGNGPQGSNGNGQGHQSQGGNGNKSPNRSGSGNRPRPRPTGGRPQPAGKQTSAGGSGNHKTSDYNSFYENGGADGAPSGGSGAKGAIGGSKGEHEQKPKPKDCKTIVKNANRRG